MQLYHLGKRQQDNYSFWLFYMEIGSGTKILAIIPSWFYFVTFVPLLFGGLPPWYNCNQKYSSYMKENPHSSSSNLWTTSAKLVFVPFMKKGRQGWQSWSGWPIDVTTCLFRKRSFSHRFPVRSLGTAAAISWKPPAGRGANTMHHV